MGELTRKIVATYKFLFTKVCWTASGICLQGMGIDK